MRYYYYYYTHKLGFGWGLCKSESKTFPLANSTKYVRENTEPSATISFWREIPYEEYEERETPESKLIWALDKLDANWQANQYHDGDVRYWADCPNGEVYYRLALEYKPQIAALEEPILTKLEKDIVAISKANIAKCGIKVK